MADYGMNLNVPQMNLNNIGLDVPGMNLTNAQTMAARQNARQAAAQTSSVNQEVMQKKQKYEQEVWDSKAVQTAYRKSLGEDGEVDWLGFSKSLSSIPNVSPNVLNEMQSRSKMLEYASGLEDDSPEKWYMTAAAVRGDWDLMGKVFDKTHGDKGAISEADKREFDWKKVQEGQMEVTDFFVKHPSSLTPYATLDPEGLEASLKRIFEGSKRRTEGGVAGKTSRESTEATATFESRIAEVKVYAKESAERKVQYKLAAEGLYDLSAPESAGVVNAADAIDAMQALKAELEAGRVLPVDVTGVGEFTNPTVRMAYQTMKEYYARPLTGAAVPDTEWPQFESEIGSWKYLSTKNGQKVMAKRVDQLINLNLNRGGLVTKDPKWYTRLKSGQVSEQSKDIGGGQQEEEDSELQELLDRY
jgi:hypothetical protein